MPLPEKTYDRLKSLYERWGLSQEDMYYAIENGWLRVSVWMPHRYMERGVMKNKQFIYVECEHKEGFIGLRPEDFHRISSTGSAELRIFCSVMQEEHILRIAYEPPQPPITVHINDLVVLRHTSWHLSGIIKWQLPKLFPHHRKKSSSRNFQCRRIIIT